MMVKGDVIHGPNGEIYRMKLAAKVGQPITAAHFEGLSGTPNPKPGDAIPAWLVPFLTTKEK